MDGGVDVGVLFTWSVRPNMVIDAKIMKKSAKSQEKEGRYDVYLLLMLRYNVHALCTFPNMVIDVNILRKSGKIRKK